jgi:hypothetical protein
MVNPVREREDTIGRLYRSFSTYPPPLHINACSCCVEPKELEILLEKRLRDLAPDELSAYAASAFLTVGERADYLYFLPRILEITATEPSWWPDPEVTGRAIRDSKPETWTAGQRNALNDYLKEIVGTAVQSSDFEQIDSWICAIGRMGFDVRPFLDLIAKRPEAVLKYFDWNADSLRRNTLSNAFWERPCPAYDAVVAWFFSDEIAKISFEAYGCIWTRAEP